MKILITGSTGLLGCALTGRLAPRCDVVGVSRHPPSTPGIASHLVCDLTDAGATERVVRTVQPDVVIHSQALSDVDRCEREPREAERHNVLAVEHLCHALRGSGTLVMAVSTDYVFDGSKGRPYDEGDAPNPVSVYGRTKLAGEQVALAYPTSVVVRPSSLFGPGRMNFCDQVVARARRKEPVEAYGDQATSPSYTEDVADGMWALLTALRGRPVEGRARIYHIVNAGGCRRVEFVERVLALVGAPRTLLRSIRMADQHRPARRPPYSVLTSRHLPSVIGRTLRPWDEALHAYLQQRHWLN